MDEESVELEKRSYKDERVRNYACVVYPESAPDDWLAKIADLKVPALVSPLHDKDINPDGSLKKAHYHVLFAFEGKKSKAQFQELSKSFGGVGTEIVQSIRGYSRYLCHLDNPEKHQYSVYEIKSFGGADYDAYVSLPSDTARELKMMQHYCKKFKIRSFSQFADICAEKFPDWHYLIVNKCTNFLKAYFSSKSFDYNARRD